MEIIRKRILIGGFPMYNKLILLLSILFFSSCEGGDLRKHLHERIYTGNDITASVYMVSEITTMHEFVDIKRWGHTRNILEANPGDIFEVVVKGDSVIVRMREGLVYRQSALELNVHIRVDSAVTQFEWFNKYGNGMEKYYSQ